MSSSGKVIRIPLQVGSAAPHAPKKQGEAADPVLEGQLQAANAFAKASTNIAALLEYINDVLKRVGWRTSADKLIPGDSFPLPVSCLETMFRTATWPSFINISKRNRTEGSPVPGDTTSLEGFIFKGPENGFLTVSADKMEATKFKEECQNAVNCMEKWLLEEHALFNIFETPAEWDEYRFQFHLIHNARQALEDWFDVLYTLLGMQDDAASINSLQTDSSGDGEHDVFHTPGSSRRSSLSGSGRPPTDVTGTIDPASLAGTNWSALRP